MSNKRSQPSRLPPWGVGIQSTLGVAAVTAAGVTFDVSPLLGAGAAVVGGLCSVLANAGSWGPPAAVGIQLGRWSALGGWFTWAWSDFGWDWSTPADQTEWLSLAALGAGCMVGAHAGPWLKRLKQQPSQERGLVLMSASRECQEWQDRIITRGGAPFRGTVVAEVTSWPNDNGKDVRVVLPVGGATADNLRTHLAGLANDCNLPHGCTIELIEPVGEGQRTVTLRVPTVNQIAENIPHPLFDEQRSVMEGIPFGVHPNGDTAQAPIREESWLVVGKRGSGKTTLLHGMTATLGICSDAVVWHIDLNGGGMTQPWVEPWLQGRVDRPPVDWAAPTVDEAILMLQAAVRIAKHRKTAYRSRKKAHNTNLLPVGDDLPEVVIMLDEGAEALEEAGKGKVGQLADLLAEIQRIARNEAVNLVLSALRATGDIVPAGMVAQTGVGVCMKVKEQKEIARVFEDAWELKLKPEHLTAKGAGWLGVDGGHPARTQAWNILPDDMEQVGMRISRARPELDEASARIAGDAYTTRYERMRQLFADDGDNAHPAVLDEVDSTSTHSVTATGGGAAASWADPADIMSTAPASDGPASLTATTAPNEPTTRVPQVLAWATRLAEDTGQPRVSTTWLIDELGLDLTPRRFGMLLAAWGAPVGKQRINGTDIRGPATRDLKAALARIESGGPVDVTPTDAE
ncbi:S-DNA-T family DNA segregation ATPase FtsK/SpoIIIE [Lipingzhangella halophila]|uniref:S-DNA-T family DNA segregation ATPase FtsK/SpoIIIE n=1 Tax=Lipingzhangella halophila TaxID=1783352 RepID=A0A7W7RG56_9ACTN|nr:DMT family transporter [Lipingzhangella halophila]MBB4931352.1 S-DNA-T family DNA segregation ATPase FtsK/SpoIIIE [Lipingzhangella halophila]